MLLATVSLLIGSLAHVSADGRLPGTTALLLLFGGLAIVCSRLLGTTDSRPRVVVLVVSGQAFIHLGLTAMAGHGSARALPAQPLPAPSPGAHASMAELMPVTPQASLAVPSWVTDEIAMLAGPHAFMAVAHLAAAALIALWLASGEAALFAVLALATGAVLRLLVALPVPPLPSTRPTHVPVARRANAHSRRDPKRGPPGRRLVAS